MVYRDSLFGPGNYPALSNAGWIAVSSNGLEDFLNTNNLNLPTSARGGRVAYRGPYLDLGADPWGQCLFCDGEPSVSCRPRKPCLRRFRRALTPINFCQLRPGSRRPSPRRWVVDLSQPALPVRGVRWPCGSSPPGGQDCRSHVFFG